MVLPAREPWGCGNEHVASMLTRRTFFGAMAAVPLVSAARAAEPVKIRFGLGFQFVGDNPFTSGSPLATAHNAFSFEQEFRDEPHIQIEWLRLRGQGPQLNEAFANGQIDFAGEGDLPSLIGRSRGLTTKILMASGTKTDTWLAVPPDSTITSIEQLRGAKVAIFRGTNRQLAVDNILAAHGLSEKDLQVYNMDIAASYAALASKNIDAAWGDSDIIALQDQGFAKVIYTTKGDDARLTRNSCLNVSETFERDHPDLVERVVKVMVQAAYWSSQEANRDALMDLWAKSGLSPRIIRAEFDGQPLAYRMSPLLDPFVHEAYRSLAKQARSYGLVRNDVSVDDWFEPRYLQAALRALGLEQAWTPYDQGGKPLKQAPA
jgi:sulfonate transport system substrate-binding protein